MKWNNVLRRLDSINVPGRRFVCNVERAPTDVQIHTSEPEGADSSILDFRSPDLTAALALLSLEMKCSVCLLLPLGSTNQRLRLALRSVHTQVLTGTTLEGQSARDEGEEQAQYQDVEAFSCRHAERRASLCLHSLQVVFNHTHTGRTHTYNRHADERWGETWGNTL